MRQDQRQERHPRLTVNIAAQGRASAKLEFAIDNKPLGGSIFWSVAPAIISGIIAEAVLNLARGDRLLLSISSAADTERSIGGRVVELAAQQIIYLDYVLTRGAKDWALIDRCWQGESNAVIVVELPDEDVRVLTKRYFEQQSFLGFVVPHGVDIDIKVLANSLLGPIDRFDPAILPDAVTWFEDADDACSLLITSKPLEYSEIARRLDVGHLHTLADSIDLPPPPSQRSTKRFTRPSGP